MENDNKITHSQIIIVLLTNLIIFAMYIFTIKINNPIFFVFFAIERMMAIQYQEDILRVMEDISADKINNKLVILVIIITIAQVVMFFYAFFNCTRLFMLLIVGEVLDSINVRIKNRFLSKK